MLDRNRYTLGRTSAISNLSLFKATCCVTHRKAAPQWQKIATSGAPRNAAGPSLLVIFFSMLLLQAVLSIAVRSAVGPNTGAELATCENRVHGLKFRPSAVLGAAQTLADLLRPARHHVWRRI